MTGHGLCPANKIGRKKTCRCIQRHAIPWANHKQTLIVRKEQEICLYHKIHVSCAAQHTIIVTAQHNHTEQYLSPETVIKALWIARNSFCYKNASNILLCFFKFQKNQQICEPVNDKATNSKDLLYTNIRTYIIFLILLTIIIKLNVLWYWDYLQQVTIEHNSSCCPKSQRQPCNSNLGDNFHGIFEEKNCIL